MAEFGKENETTLLLLHGMCSTWEMSFRPLIELAKKEFHIIAVATDGYDPENKEIHATTIEHESEQIAEYKLPKFLVGKLRKTTANIEASLIHRMMTKHQGLIVKVLGLSGVEELRKMMYIETSKTTLFNTIYHMAVYDFDYTRFEGKNVYIWSGSEEKTCLKTVKEIKRVCPSVKVRIFKDCGHGSLLTQPKRLLNEIKKTKNNP
ncbi:MAG: hypothetical protein J6A94_08225 [Lachnospiraceae bacterium]|nr:hypothetical protein [Lachnospiraceae bacterium]